MMATQQVIRSAGLGQKSVLKRCENLASKLPMLRDAFHRLKEDDGNTFPILPPNIHENVWAETRKMFGDTSPNARKAAILIPLVSYNGIPSLLYTTRSSNLSSHASEVSFPGGHFDEGVDQSLEETAVRETCEELLGDYPFDSIEILGQASPVPSMNGTPVTPVIGVFPFEVNAESFPGNPDEVDEVFTVPLDELIRIETSEYSSRFHYASPVFPTTDGQKIWGLTAIVTRPILRQLLKPIFVDS